MFRSICWALDPSPAWLRYSTTARFTSVRCSACQSAPFGKNIALFVCDVMCALTSALPKSICALEWRSVWRVVSVLLLDWRCFLCASVLPILSFRSSIALFSIIPYTVLIEDVRIRLCLPCRILSFRSSSSLSCKSFPCPFLIVDVTGGSKCRPFCLVKVHFILVLLHVSVRDWERDFPEFFY